MTHLPDERRPPSAGAVTDRGSRLQPTGAPAGGAEVADATGPAPAPELTRALGQMIAAIVRMTGAGSGALRIAESGSARLLPLALVEFPEGVGVGTDASEPIALWCSRCPESMQSGSECVTAGMCGRDERFSAGLRGRACRHVYSFPLDVAGHGAAVLNLRFDGTEGYPVAVAPAIEAAATVIGAALEQTRLAREGLRTALTNERQMIANEVHDSLAQGLTYMRMRMSLLRHSIGQREADRALKYWDDVDGSLTDAHRRLRELITYFRCRMDSQGLLHALQETSEKFLDRTGVALEFENGVPGLDLPVAREVQVFHIVQEALANVCKHADARRARLTLAPRVDGYEITVEDDGVGMAVDLAAGERGEGGHYGITIMRERARRLGGELTVDSVPGAGTRVRLYFPAMDHPTESTL